MIPFRHILYFVLLLILTSCGKESYTPDKTINWIGAYITTSHSDTSLLQLQISKVSNGSVNIVLRKVEFSYVYTVATLSNVSISGTSIVIDQDQEIIEGTDQGMYHFTGTATLTGDQMALNVTATNVKSPGISQNFVFSGVKTY